MTAAPANPYGITRLALWGDFSADAPLRDQLKKLGIPFREKPIPHLIGMAGTAWLLGYISPVTNLPVTVLVIPHRTDIDSFSEDYYYAEGVTLEDAVAKGEPYWTETVYPAVKDWSF